MGFSKSKSAIYVTHLKVSHDFNTQWLRAHLGASFILIGRSASPCVSKGCGNLWSSPTILADRPEPAAACPVFQPRRA